MFYLVLSENEVLVLRVGQDIIQEASESNDELSHKTSNQEDTVFTAIGISDIIDLNLRIIFNKISSSNDLSLDFVK